MPTVFRFFDGTSAPLMASVVAFVCFFLIARIGKARQSIAFAFAFTPLLVFCTLEAAVGLV